jgi:GNAT superfamily N-acetyltransferase
MAMLNIRNGGHADLQRYYGVMEVDFDSEELISKLNIHRAITNGTAELLVLYEEESGLDVAYALVIKKNLYGYVLVKYMGVLPWYRGHGFGLELMRKINKRYADKQGLIAEITEFEDEDADRVKKLRKFFARFGYVEIDSDYTIKGVKANVMVKPLKGSADIAPIAHRIIPDFYNRVLSSFAVDKMISIKPVKK